MTTSEQLRNYLRTIAFVEKELIKYGHDLEEQEDMTLDEMFSLYESIKSKEAINNNIDDE